MKQDTENSKEKKATLFDVLDMCTVYQKSWDELSIDEQKLWQPFIINRLVASNDLFVPILALGTKHALKPKDHYNFIQSILGKQKYYFNMKAYKSNKDDELGLFAIQKHFIVGKTDALRLIDNIHPAELDTLKRKWETFYKYQKELGNIK